MSTKEIDPEDEFSKRTIEPSDQYRLDRYGPRTFKTRVPFGYKKDEDNPGIVIPDPVYIVILDKALDQFDAGISSRQVADWINSQVPDEMKITHTGIIKLKNFYRPDSVRKLRTKPVVKRLTKEEKAERKRKYLLAQEKKRITHARKRMAKLKDELDIIEENKIEMGTSDLLMEIDYGTEEYKTITEDKDVNIVFQPNPGPQTAFFAADEQEVLYGGAAGGGKSYAILADPMRYFSNPHFRGLILRRTNDELRELIDKSYVLYKGYLPDAKWNEQKKEWAFPSGAKLWMTYLEQDKDVHRYQGQSFSYIAFDELTQYATPYAWNYMRSRLRSTDPELPVYQRATSNPGGVGHGWVKKMFIDPSPAGQPFWATDEDDQVIVFPHTHERAGQPLFQRRFIPARLKDNPYLWEDGRYEINLLSLPENQRKQLLEGDWNVADGAAFPEFNTSIHVVPSRPVDKTWRRFRSCDYGYSTRQASAVLWYAINPITDQLEVYRELYINQLTGRELARKIIEIEKDANERMTYGVLDSSCWAQRGQSGPSIAEEMISEGCRWKPSDRTAGSRIAGKNRIHELLRTDPLNKQPGIVFHDSCRKIISTLPIIPSDTDSDDIDQKFADDHAYDSLRYGVMSRPKSGMDEWHRSKFETPYRPADATFGY